MERIKTSLELEDEIKLHETGWIIQRVGWAVILLLLTGSALGLFGTGILSKMVITEDGHNITFEKFARYEAPMQMTVHAESRDNKITIHIPQTYFEFIELDKIVPEPGHQTLANGVVSFSFTSEVAATVKFYLIPEKTGQVKTKIQVNESDFLITHFIYP